jgi:gamma-glutamyl:cysteine ligase YbdK (ATP-grasp superfamily)
MNITKEQFFAKFTFNRSKTGWVGVEREQFLVDPDSSGIAPLAPVYLRHVLGLNGKAVSKHFNFGYELSACQLESRIGPCRLNMIGPWLEECEKSLRGIDKHLGFSRLNSELAPQDMSLDIYPDPTGRYQTITQSMPVDVLRAACRVAGTHIHVGMPDMDTAVDTYNRVICHTNKLIRMGDSSSGERMKLYPLMAPRYVPEQIASPDDYYEQALQYGFVQDPRKCWTLVRISIHGTIEFRMFGAVDSIDKIVGWVKECHALCF